MKMKKVCSLFLALVMLLVCLVGCGSSSSSSSSGTSDSSTSTSDSSASSTDSSAETSEDSSSDATETATEVSYGGSITVYYTSDIDANYDPTIGDNAGYNLWMETLFTYDISLSGVSHDLTSTNLDYTCMTGQLAESWEWDEENATFTVNLRQDVYFQDKEPFNGRQLVAEDVKWTYDRTLGIGSGYDTPYEATNDWTGYLSYIESIETDGDFTVIFHFYEDQANELTMSKFMTTALSISGHEWDELTEEQQSSYEYACGTGPYILEELVAGTSCKLVKNENYYGTDTREGYEGNQLPYIDEINFVYISDSTNAVVQFISGDLDIICGRTNILSDSEVAQLEASGVDYYEKDFDIGRTEVIMLRCNSEPFSDINVRKALQNAIDLEAVMADYYGLDLTIAGIYAATEDYAYTQDEWSDELTAQYTYDPDLATQLLEEAGYGDGLEFTVVISPDNDVDLFTYINSQYFAPLGITMNLESVSNFMEAKTIGNDETDTRSTAGTGIIGGYAAYKNTGARTYTLDGSWGGAMWTGDTVWSAMLDECDATSDFESMYALCEEQDEYFLEQHWVTYMSGVTEVNEFFSGRVQGLAEGDRFYNPTYMGTLLMNMWVTD